jgi:hypothetical protein
MLNLLSRSASVNQVVSASIAPKKQTASLGFQKLQKEGHRLVASLEIEKFFAIQRSTPLVDYAAIDSYHLPSWMAL